MWAWTWFVLFLLTAFMLVGAFGRVKELERDMPSDAPGRLTKQKDVGPSAPAGVASRKPRHPVQWHEGERGEAAAFTYVDADGVVTDRDVRNWRSEGPHIKAHCLMASASRTFRKDRIEDWRASQ